MRWPGPVTLLCLFGALEGAPLAPPSPSWHLPCGPAQNATADPNSSGAEAMTHEKYLRSVRMQHQMALDQYLVRDFDFLYEKIKIGTEDHQYIPNWIPGRREVHDIRKRLSRANHWKVINHMPTFHYHLQKFAVAFEELVFDEDDEKLKEALAAMQSYLMLMLCEIESGLFLLPVEKVLTRVPREIMSPDERNPVDWTKKKIRDWGILLKYRDYLHAWRHVFHY